MMIFLTHPNHGEKVAYTEGEAVLDMKNGWARRKDGPVITVAPQPAEPAPSVDLTMDREALVVAYVAKHGRKPHPRMSMENLSKALA